MPLPAVAADVLVEADADDEYASSHAEYEAVGLGQEMTVTKDGAISKFKTHDLDGAALSLGFQRHATSLDSQDEE